MKKGGKALVGVTVAILILSISLGYVASKEEKKGSEDIGKIIIIHTKGSDKSNWIKNPKKPENRGKGKKNVCYRLLGVRWKNLPVSYVVNPSNDDGLSGDFVISSIYASAEEWDSHTSSEIFNDSYVVDSNATWDGFSIPDGRNELVFGYFPQSSAIAITVVWYSKKTKEIIEFDTLFNDYYKWGDATQDGSVMDLQNIATHEIGHGLGLSDLYNINCYNETMYGYSDYGEVKKRSLENGDIAGLQKMYGE